MILPRRGGIRLNAGEGEYIENCANCNKPGCFACKCRSNPRNSVTESWGNVGNLNHMNIAGIESSNVRMIDAVLYRYIPQEENEENIELKDFINALADVNLQGS